MFRAAEALTLFPTHVWVFDLETDEFEPINTRIMEQVTERLPDIAELSQTYALQSETNIHEDDYLSILNKYILTAGKNICDGLNLQCNYLTITGCWLNIGKPGCVHKEHSHPNNFLSAVYYVNANPGANSITFSDPRPQASVILPKMDRPAASLANSVTLETTPGRLLIFPAWLRHSVRENESAELRVSIAYNMLVDTSFDELAAPLFRGDFSLTKEDA